MKKIHIALLPAPGLLNCDVKAMCNSATTTGMPTIVKDIIRVVAYFITLVLVFVVMFGFFFLASSVPEPTQIIIEKGGHTYGTSTHAVSSRI